MGMLQTKIHRFVLHRSGIYLPMPGRQGERVAEHSYQEIGIVFSNTVMFNDNNGICLAKNGWHHRRSKHMDLRCHFVRDLVQQGHLTLRYCPTAAMLADLLTKAFPKDRFELLRNGIGIRIVPSTGLKGGLWEIPDNATQQNQISYLVKWMSR